MVEYVSNQCLRLRCGLFCSLCYFELCSPHPETHSKATNHLHKKEGKFHSATGLIHTEPNELYFQQTNWGDGILHQDSICCSFSQNEESLKLCARTQTPVFPHFPVSFSSGIQLCATYQHITKSPSFSRQSHSQTMFNFPQNRAQKLISL